MSRTHGPRALLAAAALWALPALAIDTELAGAPLHLTLTEWATSAYHLDNGNIAPPGSAAYDPTGNNYGDWLNRFQVDAAWRDLTLMARLDSAIFVNAPVAAPGSRFVGSLRNRYTNRVDVEKVALAYSNKWIDVTVGDVYTTYGRGLVLALRKLDVLGIDTTARGASVTGKLGDFTLNALGGFGNVVNVDAATGRSADDPNDLIVGTHADYRFGKWVVPSFNASWVRLAQNAIQGVPQQNPDQTASVSGSLELPNLFGYGSAYAEYARQQKLVGDLPYQASAAYLYLTLAFGPATLLAEYKNYRHYVPIATSIDPLKAPELALTDTYTALPTLERLEQAVLNNTDVTGPRVRVDVAVTDTITPFVSVAAFDDRIFNVRIFDPYGGVEVTWQEARSRASVSGGMRPTFHDAPGFFGVGAASSSTWHVKYLASQWLTGPYSLELNGLHMSHKDDVGGRWVPWMEGQAYLSLKKAMQWSVAVGYEYFTEAPQTTRTQYLNVNLAYTINRNLTLRAMGGGQRGGIKCVNGICRTYPAFDGARLEIVAKY